MKSSVAVRQVGRLVRVGNGIIELGFDTRANGALVSLIDKQSRYEFIRDQQAPKSLFRLAYRDRERKVVWLDGCDATRFRWTQHATAESATLSLEASGFAGQSLVATVDVTVTAGSPLSVWRMRISGAAADQSVYHITCPLLSGVLKVGDGVPGEVLATPRQSEGYLFRDPFPVVDNLPLMAGKGPEQPAAGVGSFSQMYPGTQAMQFVLYYNDRAGLYLASHDAGMHCKVFACGPVEGWGDCPTLSIGHYQPERPGGALTIGYDTIVGVFHGDWYDGADLYKQWARQQWWCRKRLAERDIASWLRSGVGVWQMSNYHIPKLKLNHSLDQIATEVNGIAKDAGVPLLALIFNFERGGAWTGPIGFPPKEGDDSYRAAMAKLRDAGNHGFVYMPGGNWYVAIDSYDPPFDSWREFEQSGRPNAIVNDKGEENVSSWYQGWHSSWLCPATKGTHDIQADLLLGSLKLGTTMVQIDNFPCGGSMPCYSGKHGHPIGYGPWYAEAWRKILDDVRRRAKQINPDCAISTEGICETYIPYLDLYDHRGGNMEYFGHRYDSDPMHGEIIPIFGYVYGGYIGGYLAAYPDTNRPEVLYWTRSLGMALAHGIIPNGGRYWPEPKQSNPVTLAFYKKVIRATVRDCWRFIMFGEMLRPPKIKVPKIEASYLRFSGECLDHLLGHNRHVVTDDAVQHSVWRAEDGTIGYIFVNVSQEPVRFDVRLSGYADGKGRFDADVIVDSRRQRLFRKQRLPKKHTLQMKPLSVSVIEIKATG